jgi:hypothetical protein
MLAQCRCNSTFNSSLPRSLPPRSASIKTRAAAKVTTRPSLGPTGPDRVGEALDWYAARAWSAAADAVAGQP